ncbi:hypothetical protein LOCC1_G008582 [Lachnellula occidentalis]|uniref:DUF7732 domain-containing protein n=1 Tax=Lachnellula occidentalis TaxID=215460 RepID=A0A8H8RCF9_9HELO|nr:hypothetical protein LOCC1_G008582 [Lachnellula occidentalis]
MRFSTAFTALLALPASTFAAPHPIDTSELVERDYEQEAAVLDTYTHTRDLGFFADVSDLWKRKGGGGGGGKGGGGSSSSGGSSSGSGKGGGSSSSSGSSGSSSSGSRGSSSSNAGGSTKTGSGVTPRYGGYYGGGAKTPYSAGARSPGGVSPLLLGAAVGGTVGLGIGLAAYPGHWPYGAYAYPYGSPYTFHNRTARRNSSATSTSSSISATATPTNAARSVTLETRQDADQGINQTKPVTCLCAQYAVCGCDDNNNATFLNSLIGDGTYTNLNTSLVNVADINGTSTIVLNGTLPNGTTASGGTENASGAVSTISNLAGYWVMVALVGCTAFLI